jgi:hypothetical protein
MPLPKDVIDAMDDAAAKSRAARAWTPPPAATTDHLVKWADLPAVLLEAETALVEMLVLPLQRRVKALEAQVAALEARPQLKYLGTYKPDAVYSENSLTTYDGSLFIARKETRATPGDGNQDWQLCTKRGRDGRDAKDSAP